MKIVISFIWYAHQQARKNVCKKLKGYSVDIFHFKTLHYIFNAIMASKHVPNIILEGNMIHNYLVKITWQHNKINFKYTTVKNIIKNGHFFCKFRSKERSLTLLIFHCMKGGFISYSYVCDGNLDCPNYDDTDESNCTNEMNMSKRHCFSLYQMSKYRQCKQFREVINVYFKLQNKSDKNTLAPVQKAHFKCTNGYHIDSKLFNDLIADCGPAAEDEPLLKSILSNKNILNLCKPSEIPCMYGHAKCYNFSDICIFKLNQFHYLTPCRNGANLQRL